MFINRRKIKTKQTRHKKLSLFLSSLSLVVFILLGSGMWIYVSLNHIEIVSPLPLINDMVQAVQNNGKGEKDIKISLEKKHIRYKTVQKQAGDTYLIKLENDVEVKVTTQKDIDKQISSLQLIYSRLTMEGRQFVSLDLRFEKPVIVLR